MRNAKRRKVGSLADLGDAEDIDCLLYRKALEEGDQKAENHFTF
jgi:hypothetical protein